MTWLWAEKRHANAAWAILPSRLKVFLAHDARESSTWLLEISSPRLKDPKTPRLEAPKVGERALRRGPILDAPCFTSAKARGPGSMIDTDHHIG